MNDSTSVIVVGWTPDEFRNWWVDSVTRLLTATGRDEAGDGPPIGRE